MFNDLIDGFVSTIASELPGPDESSGAAKDLSEIFTSDRDEMAGDYFSEGKNLNAYLSAFLIPNAAKVMHCLMQMDGLDLIPKKDSIFVLDLGSGPGTAVLAASYFFSMKYPDMKVLFAGMERNKIASIKAHELFKRVAPPNHSFESATVSLSPGMIGTVLKGHRFDIAFASNLLNEFDTENDAYEFCAETMANHLDDDGLMLVIDPALKNTTRQLMRTRDRLLSDGIATIKAPCLHDEFCPMLEGNERDWCHFYIDWKRPEYIAQVDHTSGMDHKHLKMAYFILARKSLVTSHGALKWRVVSSPLVSKGKVEVVLCGSDGKLKRSRRLNRKASDANGDFDTIMRGDIVSTGGDIERIESSDEFRILSTWSDT